MSMANAINVRFLRCGVEPEKISLFGIDDFELMSAAKLNDSIEFAKYLIRSTYFYTPLERKLRHLITVFIPTNTR